MRAVTWDGSRLESQFPPPIKKAYLVFGENKSLPVDQRTLSTTSYTHIFPKSSTHAFPRQPRRVSTATNGHDSMAPQSSPSSFSYSPLIKNVTYWPEQGRAVWPPVVSNLRLLHGESGSEPSSPSLEVQIQCPLMHISPSTSSTAGRPGHLT